MQFQLVQQAFIAHIKDPNQNPRPADVAPARMAVYNELFFNNVLGFVSNAYPVLKSLYSDTAWLALIRQFFSRYQCSSPYFLHIAEHFLDFLQTDYQRQAADPCFLNELAHYEWAELYLSTKQSQHTELTISPELAAGTALKLSDLSLVLAYPYPVHQISTEFQPKVAGDVQCYLLYRNEQDEVKFVLINPLTAALLEALQQAPGSTVQQLAQQLQHLTPQFSVEQLEHGACSILQDFAAKGVVVSFQAAQNSLP